MELCERTKLCVFRDENIYARSAYNAYNELQRNVRGCVRMSIETKMHSICCVSVWFALLAFFLHLTSHFDQQNRFNETTRARSHKSHLICVPLFRFKQKYKRVCAYCQRHNGIGFFSQK